MIDQKSDEDISASRDSLPASNQSAVSDAQSALSSAASLLDKDSTISQVCLLLIAFKLLSRCKILFGNFPLKVFHVKIFSENSIPSKQITFEILFSNIEHVLFCEKKFQEVLLYEILLDFRNKKFLVYKEP